MGGSSSSPPLIFPSVSAIPRLGRFFKGSGIGSNALLACSAAISRSTANGSETSIRSAAAVSLYVAHYNFCRPHESLTPDARNQTTPAMALGITDHVWSIGEVIDAALATLPVEPVTPKPGQRRQFRVIEGGRVD